MKMPNRAVKMGGIFAVGAGLVAIALSVVLLVPNTTQAHPEPTPQTVIVATPEPTSQPASALESVPARTSQQSLQAGQMMEQSGTITNDYDSICHGAVLDVNSVFGVASDDGQTAETTSNSSLPMEDCVHPYSETTFSIKSTD